MPNVERILKVLENERECIARQSRPLGEMPQCRKDEDGVKLCEYCDLCLPDDEILEVYDHLIKIFENEALYVKVDVNEAEQKRLFQLLADAGFTMHPDLIEKYGIQIKDGTD